jgi:hypothetical protein
MLSKDDISNGTNFILRLLDKSGAPVHWVQTLSGATALHWYDIYRRSDDEALRTEGGEVFRTRVAESEAEHTRRSGRCIVIHTPSVKAEEIDAPSQLTKPLQPGWESEGGSLAPPAPGRG